MNEIIIDLSRCNGEMKFMVSNTTDNNGKAPRDGGIGLPNVRRRLELLYPHKHHMEINERKGWFDVELKMKIDLVDNPDPGK
jgi:LytS/YehU family sensor histidine kinase